MPECKLIIVGAGGLGREVSSYAREALGTEGDPILGFLDDKAPPPDVEHLLAAPWLGPISTYTPSDDESFVVAIGDPTSRAKVVEGLKSRGARFITVRHPSAYVAANATIGQGAILAPFCTVGAGAQIGAFAHLHFYSSAAHDTRLHDFATLSPYAVANGGSVIGEGVFLGSRATVNPITTVGRYSKVTAGSVVYQDVPPGSIAHGNPAKARPRLERELGRSVSNDTEVSDTETIK